MASTLPEATSSQHSSRAGRSAELAASEPQPAAPPLPLACELTGGGPRSWDGESQHWSFELPPPLPSPASPNKNRHPGAPIWELTAAVLCGVGKWQERTRTLKRFKYRLGCCETVGKYRLALHECLDGREPTRRNVSSLTCRVEGGGRAGRVGVGSRDCTAGCPSGGRSLAGERPPALHPLAGCVTVHRGARSDGATAQSQQQLNTPERLPLAGKDFRVSRDRT